MRDDLRSKIIAIRLWVGGCFLFASLFTYTPQDIPWESAPAMHPVRNSGGIVGAYLAYGLFKGLGWSAVLLAVLLGIWGWMCWQGVTLKLATMRVAGTAIFLLAASALWGLGQAPLALRLERGGALGVMTAEWLSKYLGVVAYLVGSCVVVLALLAITDFLVLAWATAGAKALWNLGAAFWVERRAGQMRARTVDTMAQQRQEAKDKRPEESRDHVASVPAAALAQPRVIKTIAPKTPVAARAEASAPTKPRRSAMAGAYQLPPINLLSPPPPLSERTIKDNLEANSRTLEETLRDFDIQAQVVEVEKGPAITRYELQLAPGTKMSRIASLSEEIGLMLKAQSVRVAPIPGKSRVGIEIPNTTSATVYLREVIESPAFQRSRSKLTLALGKTVAGDMMVTDLRDCPHLLVAGTTGSGKTVCLNALITGFLYSATPDELRLLLIDPKMVEMAVFNGLPHLVAPVVTDAKKASAALGWAVTEMERRYKLLAEVGVRNIDGYNERIKADAERRTPNAEQTDDNSESPEPLPYLVLVIDELADLMVVAAQEVEGTIMRLAQLSRAVGIHLIMATQRPSVDVITGVIKANLPARISFQVASRVDSRTVLDMIGADKLLGRGDLLFLNPGSSKPTRAQGCYLSDAEIERVVAHVKAQRPAVYDDGVMALQEKSAVTMRGERDEFFEDAKQVILQTGQASTSMLQRRLRLGYTRAARLLDQLEEAGIVGPPRGAKPRDILVERPVGVEHHETVEDSA